MSESGLKQIPEPTPDDSKVDEKLDGVVYRDDTWYVTFGFQGESTAVLEFSYCEFVIPEEQTPDEYGEMDGVLEKLRHVPDEILGHVSSEGYEIAGHDTEDGDGADPENWLYDGECPDCGDVLVIERVGQSDVCYDCGTEVDDS